LQNYETLLFSVKNQKYDKVVNWWHKVKQKIVPNRYSIAKFRRKRRDSNNEDNQNDGHCVFCQAEKDTFEHGMCDCPMGVHMDVELQKNIIQIIQKYQYEMVSMDSFQTWIAVQGSMDPYKYQDQWNSFSPRLGLIGWLPKALSVVLKKYHTMLTLKDYSIKSDPCLDFALFTEVLHGTNMSSCRLAAFSALVNPSCYYLGSICC
jgi:hypothetical protein